MNWRAKPQTVDNVRFASGDEAARYSELKLMRFAGQIATFECHPSWSFELNGVTIGRYTADFEIVYPNGEVVIEDVKGNGPTSRDYILRKKLLLAFYGLPVTEVRMRARRKRVA